MKQRFFVAGIPDKKLGERLVLFLELESAKVSKFKTLIEAEIKNLESLSKFEIPKEIYFLDAFIDTETKKIQRKKTIDLI
jgi:O-succinylbenzoic acid--CoA ligase